MSGRLGLIESGRKAGNDEAYRAIDKLIGSLSSDRCNAVVWFRLLEAIDAYASTSDGVHVYFIELVWLCLVGTQCLDAVCFCTCLRA